MSSLIRDRALEYKVLGIVFIFHRAFNMVLIWLLSDGTLAVGGNGQCSGLFSVAIAFLGSRSEPRPPLTFTG